MALNVNQTDQAPDGTIKVGETTSPTPTNGLQVNQTETVGTKPAETAEVQSTTPTAEPQVSATDNATITPTDEEYTATHDKESGRFCPRKDICFDVLTDCLLYTSPSPRD